MDPIEALENTTHQKPLAYTPPLETPTDPETCRKPLKITRSTNKRNQKPNNTSNLSIASGLATCACPRRLRSRFPPKTPSTYRNIKTNKVNIKTNKTNQGFQRVPVLFGGFYSYFPGLPNASPLQNPWKAKETLLTASLIKRPSLQEKPPSWDTNPKGPNT